MKPSPFPFKEIMSTYTAFHSSEWLLVCVCENMAYKDSYAKEIFSVMNIRVINAFPVPYKLIYRDTHTQKRQHLAMDHIHCETHTHWHTDVILF